MKKHATWFSLLMGLVFFINACDGGKGGGDADGVRPAKTKILDEGTGEPNTEPLWPLREGAAFFNESGVPLAWVGPPRRLGDYTVFRVIGEQQVDWFEAAEDGVYYHGNSRAGRKPRPMLWYPATVRVGMRWHSWLDGDAPQVLHEVTAMAEEDTMWGRRRVWDLRREDLALGEVTTDRFVEGRGPLDTEYGIVSGTVPLEDSPVEPPTPVALEVMGDGAPWFVDRRVDHVSAVDRGDGVLQVRLEGTYLENNCVQRPCTHVEVPVVSCLSLDTGTLAGNWVATDLALEDATCCDAMATVPDDRGEWSEHPLHWRGAMVKEPADNPDQVPETLYAALTRMDGSVKVFGGAGVGRLGWGSTLSRVLQDWDTAAAHGFPIPVWDSINREAISRSAVLLPLVLYSEVAGFGVVEPRGVWWLRFVNGALRDQSLVRHPTGRWATSVNPTRRRFFLLTEDGRVDEYLPTPDGPLLAHVSDVDLPARHLLVGVIPAGDGYVAVTWEQPDPADPTHPDTGLPRQGDVYLWRLTPAAFGTPAPPPAATALSARRDGADVELCWPPGYKPPVLDGWSLGGEPARATRSRLDGTCVVVLRDFGTSLDLAASGAYTTEGPVPWVGPVAFAFAASSRATKKSGGASSGAPGILPVYAWGGKRVGLANGEMVSSTEIAGPAGTFVGALPFAVDAGLLSRYPDLGGGGLWSGSNRGAELCPYADYGLCTAVAFTGFSAGVRTFPFRSELDEFIIGSAWGGGVLVRWSEEASWQPSYTTYTHLHPDGTLTSLPDPSGSSLSWHGIQANERVCRVGESYEGLIHCEEPGGVGFDIVYDSGLEVPKSWFPVSEDVAWLLVTWDDATVQSSAQGTYAATYNLFRVDTGARTLTSVSLADVFPIATEAPNSQIQLQVGAPGQLYGLVAWRAEDGTRLGWDFFRFTPEGIEPIDVDAIRPLFDPVIPPFMTAPSGEFFFFSGARWGSSSSDAGLVRVPRALLEP